MRGVNPFVATLAATAAGAAAGIVTALVHTKLRINNIIAGIIVMTALYTVNLRVMGKANIGLLNTPTVFSDAVAALNRFGFNWPTTTRDHHRHHARVARRRALCGGVVLRTDLGLAVRATGQNETMILSLGVDVDKTKMVGLALSNGFIALSGALVAQNHGFADIGMGIGILVAGAAAVLIGEAIFGDRTVGWWVFAAIIGSLIYRFLAWAALRLGLNANRSETGHRGLLLSALAIPQLRTRIFK